MSSLPSNSQSASKAKYTSRHDSSSNAPPPSVHQHDTTFGSWFALDQNDALMWPSTRSTSHQTSESSETTMLGGFYDGGTFDNASSVTLQDEFPWHEVEVNKYTQRIPSTIVPALLQGVSDVSPSSRSSPDRAEGESREVDEESDSGDALPRYSTTQKGKWKARTEDDIGHGNRWARIESPRFHFQGIHNVGFFVPSIGGTGSTSQRYSPSGNGLCITDRFYKIMRTARRRCHSAKGLRFQYIYSEPLIRSSSDIS